MVVHVELQGASIVIEQSHDAFLELRISTSIMYADAIYPRKL